ncbi:MAG: cytochrome c [Myxococcota bacterium]
MTLQRTLVRFLLSTLATGSLAGCQGMKHDEPPIVPIRNMYNQPRYDAQDEQDFWADGRAMRMPVEGSVSREMEPNLPFATGRTEDDSRWVLEVPAPVVARNGGAEDFLDRGEQRFNIYCAPCHAIAGNGNGMVSYRAVELGYGTLNAPSLHDDRIRSMPDGQLYATITNGVRAMPAYAQSVPQDDRWAIVSYVRALQLSQLSLQARNGAAQPAAEDSE